MHLNQSRYGWSKVALLYDNNESLLSLRELLHLVGTQVARSDLPPLALLMLGSQDGEALSLITRQLVNDWEEGYRGTLREVET